MKQTEASPGSAMSRLRRRMRRWMLRTRPPEPQPIRLQQSRVYVLPTGPGLGVVVTLGLMFIASLNYNLALGYASTFILGGVWIGHILESWRALVGLEISIRSIGEAFAGDSARFEVVLANRHRRERPAIRIRAESGQNLLMLDVASHSSNRGEFSLPCAQRGRMGVGQLTIACHGPLGWIRAWSYIEPDAVAVVFPHPAGTLGPPAAPGAQMGLQGGRLDGHDDFAGLRAWHEGDSPRHVAWKNAARGQGLFTKQLTGYQAPEVILDWALMPGGMPSEHRLSQLAQWVLDARTAGACTTLVLPDGRSGPGQTATHHHECLTRLALFGDADKI